MNLNKLLCGLDVPCSGTAEIEVTGIATDSSAVLPGNVFVCIKGEHTDGHIYADEAVKRGAAVIVSEREIYVPVPVITVPSTRRAAAFMWNNLYGRPSENMTLIAVTGTNGKTSVAYILRHILSESGVKCGIIGTLGCMAGDKELHIGSGSEIVGAAAAMTTPDPMHLYGALYEMNRMGVDCVVMEASSHALAQHKLSPIDVDIAIFTGLSAEHMDYHGTMDNYLAAKSVLFRQAKQGIINFDDPYAKRLCGLVPGDYVRVGTDGSSCDGVGYDVVYTAGMTEYTYSYKGMSERFCCPMPGRFGLYNSLLSATAAIEAGVPFTSVRDALRTFPGVPGRMETVAKDCGITVIIDYAHTPEALKNAAEIVATATEGGLWLVFGCGGDRDKTKRPIMGRIASEIADYTVITSDNPRTEDRESIISDIMAGFDRSKPHSVITDRAEAIRYAVLSAREGDIVLLCGKGHEKYEITLAGKHPFDETAIVKAAIKERAEQGHCPSRRKG